MMVASDFMPTSIYDHLDGKQRSGWSDRKSKTSASRSYNSDHHSRSAKSSRKYSQPPLRSSHSAKAPQSISKRRNNLPQQSSFVVYDYDDYTNAEVLSKNGYGKVDRSGDAYISTSSYGSGGGGYHECCELVADPLTFLMLLLAIGGATFFLNIQITMILGRKRRRRSIGADFGSMSDIVNLGK